MGITGELVRSVFSKSRSVGSQENNVRRSTAVDKKRWSTVRSYLCGDEANLVLTVENSASLPEFSSVVAEDSSDSASTSVRSSEATVTQPVPEEFTDKGEAQTEEKYNSAANLYQKEDAARVIQSAFRNFLASCGNRDEKLVDGKQEQVVGTGSPSRESVGTSIEVHTGNSADVFSFQEEPMAVLHQPQLKTKSQILRLKEDWDDSTLSSHVLNTRIRNRVEATTRRERALAYAFSQQLRICSKKKPTVSDGAEPNMGQSWLERWMATRQPEGFLIDESHTSNQPEPPNYHKRSLVGRRLFDIAGEEKESCGSNEVSTLTDSISVSSAKQRDYLKPAKNKLKATRSISRRKTVPSSYHHPQDHIKVSKKGFPREEEQDKKQKPRQPASKREIKCNDSTSCVT